jgi:hypothetical protein
MLLPQLGGFTRRILITLPMFAGYYSGKVDSNRL